MVRLLLSFALMAAFTASTEVVQPVRWTGGSQV